jgi:non-ribosomal peptide synthetase-like protein
VSAAGLAQFSLLYGFLAILSAPIALLVSEHARKVSLFTVTRWDLILPVIALLMSIVVPVVLKWTLIGRFEAGTYPLWGSYYCRWWIVRKALEFSPMHMLAGSPLFAIYARLLGARISDGAHVGTAQLHLPDLIEIGDEANVGYEVELQTFVVEEGWLHQSPIRIDARAYIGTKAVLMPGVTIGTEARVSEQSLVTRDQVIGAGESWSGSPASRSANRDALLDRMEAHAAPGSTASPLLWFGYSLAFVILELLPLVIAAPGVLVIALADRMGGRPWALAATPVAGLAFVLTACFIVAAGKRMVMPRATPGFYRATSWFGLRKYIADKLMQVSLTLTNTLYATLYVVPFLRVLGARIGPRSEISTVSHIDPDLLVLGSETFVADLAAIGSATYHAGNVALERTVIGDRTFIGNASVVRSHTHLPENCLIGVQSVAPAETPQPGTSWLGSPAMYLPRRQSCEGFGESVTYRPPARLVAYRYFVEFFRIVLPPALLYVLGTSVTIAALQLVTRVSPTALAALMPALYFATAFTITTFVAAVKWAVVGKYRPRIEPLWAPFVRHTEFITGLYESVVVPVLAGLLTGTPLIAPLLRGFGVSVGRRVWLETSFMTEFDLVHVEADAAIGRAASLQTHLFEDRVMKMSKLQVGAGASVGSRAVVLYDATVGERTHLDALSLAMKGESLPPSSDWCGIPAKLQ